MTKIIKEIRYVTVCFDCPFSTSDSSIQELLCGYFVTTGQEEDFRPLKSNKIPDWCPLDDLKE